MKRRLDERDGDGGGGKGGGAHALGEHVRVQSAEGEEVAWSRLAALRSAALANWVNNTGGGEGAFATLVPAAALRTLSRVAEGLVWFCHCARSACGFWSRVASEGPLEGRGRAEGEQPGSACTSSKQQGVANQQF